MLQIPLAGRFALLLALVLPAAPAHAQTFDDLYLFGRRAPAVGPRLTAMGGAATAGLGDWTAAYANPAGLAYLKSAQAVGSADAFVQETTYRDFTLDATEEGALLGTVGLAVPLPVARGALVFGGGYQTTANYRRTVETPFREPVSQESGWQGEVSLAGAVALTPRLMGGLSVNAPVGRFESDAFAVAAGNDLYLTYTEAELYGVNARAGLSLALNYGVRLGLTVETPTYLRIEHAPFFGYPEAVPPRSVAMTTPWRVGLGFLAGGPGLLVSADVEVVDWGQARFDADGDRDLRRENAFARADFRAVLNSRVGAEALLGPVALRVGAAFRPDPRFVGPVPARVGQTYAVGAGVNVHPQARLDVAFVHTREPDGVVSIRGDIGDLEVVRNAVQLGLDVRF